MSLFEDALRNNGHDQVIKENDTLAKGKAHSIVTTTKLIQLKKRKRSRNIKQIFILSFDALRERKVRSALTMLMVVVGVA